MCCGALGGAAVFEFAVAGAPAALPGANSSKGGEPEDREERIEGGVGVDVGEAPGAAPHGDEDLVGQTWEGKEALHTLPIQGA